MATNLRERLLEALNQRPSVKAADLARAAGVRPPSVSSWLSGDTKTIRSEYLLPVARALEVEPEWLATGRGSMRSGSTGPASVPSHDAQRAARRIPVVGTASMGMDGYWLDLEYPAGHGDGYFSFPSEDPDAYVLQVKGGSMHPAIRSGWYVLIEPNSAVQPGEYVMVKLVDGRSTVKELLWHKEHEFTLLAVADGTRLTLDEMDIEKVHAVKAILAPSGRRV